MDIPAFLKKLGMNLCQPRKPIPDGVICDEKNRPLPVLYLQGSIGKLNCRALQWQNTIQQVKLKAKRALVLEMEGQLYILYRFKAAEKSFAPLLLDIVTTEPIECPFGILFGSDPHPPLTPEQIVLAETLDMPMCERLDGRKYLSSWAYVTAASRFMVLNQASRLIQKFGLESKKILKWYDVVPTQRYTEFTNWLLDLPSLGYIDVYYISDFDDEGWFQPGRKAENFLDKELCSILSSYWWSYLESHYRLPPGTYRRFDYADKWTLVWVPTDRPMYYTFLRLLFEYKPDSRETIAAQLSFAGSLVQERPELFETISKLLIQLLQTQNYSATQISLVLKELDAAWEFLSTQKKSN